MNKGDTVDFLVRPARPDDVPSMLMLVKELAEYEKEPLEVVATEESMLEDGFGDDPVYEALVAESTEFGVLGICIFYEAYSTWRGRILYLDDLVVSERFRGSGIGMKLFQQLINIANERPVNQIRWQVLDWNEPAINFYKKLSAELDPTWINGKLRREQIEKLASK